MPTNGDRSSRASRSRPTSNWFTRKGRGGSTRSLWVLQPPLVRPLDLIGHLLARFFFRRAFDAGLQIDVEHPHADRFAVGPIRRGVDQATRPLQAVLRSVELVEPLNDRHHLFAAELEFFRGQAFDAAFQRAL